MKNRYRHIGVKRPRADKKRLEELKAEFEDANAAPQEESTSSCGIPEELNVKTAVF